MSGAEIEGNDGVLLRSESGEVLDALDHLANQAHAQQLSQGERVFCDVEGFRSMREAELQQMAQHAAERVQLSGVPFTFGPMNLNERCIIHLALANDETLQTESIGEGNSRRLKVGLRSLSE